MNLSYSITKKNLIFFEFWFFFFWVHHAWILGYNSICIEGLIVVVKCLFLSSSEFQWVNPLEGTMIIVFG